MLGSIIDENNDDTGSGSDLIPPAPQPNCGLLNMENDEAAKIYIFCYLKKTDIYMQNNLKGLCSEIRNDIMIFVSGNICPSWFIIVYRS